MEPTFSIMVPRVPVASSTARMSTAPLSAVWVRVALISWIEAEVWSTFAASASALRARFCICEAISTMVDEVSSVELDCISAPFAIWDEEEEISSADCATAREETAIWVAISRRFFTICRIECSSHPISSRDLLRMSVVRSPLETCSARIPSWVRGSAISRARPRARSTPAPIVTAMKTMIMVRESWKICSAARTSLPAALSRLSARRPATRAPS